MFMNGLAEPFGLGARRTEDLKKISNFCVCGKK
jgi:hypothetical protein